MDILGLLPSFQRNLRARNRAPRTIQSYSDVTLLDRYLEREQLPRDAEAIERKHVEAFIADQRENHSAQSASNRYNSLQQFFRWAYEDDEIDTSPMPKMTPPDVVDQSTPRSVRSALRCRAKHHLDGSESPTDRAPRDPSCERGGTARPAEGEVIEVRERLVVAPIEGLLREGLS